MQNFTLLAGSHVIGDRVYMPSDVVPSDDDLVKLHGREKFALLPAPEVVYVVAPVVAPVLPPEAPEADTKPKAKAK